VRVYWRGSDGSVLWSRTRFEEGVRGTGSTDIVVVLGPWASVKGRVYGTDGSPVAGLAIDAVARPPWDGEDPEREFFRRLYPGVLTCTVRTDAQGSFEIRRIQPGATLAVRPGKGTPALQARSELPLRAGGPYCPVPEARLYEVALQFRKLGEVELVWAGAQTPGSRVSFCILVRADGRKMIRTFQTAVGESRLVPPLADAIRVAGDDNRVAITVWAYSEGVGWARSDSELAGESIRIALNPGTAGAMARLEGRVLDLDDETPLAGIPLSLALWTLPGVGHSTTGVDGKFSFEVPAELTQEEGERSPFDVVIPHDIYMRTVSRRAELDRDRILGDSEVPIKPGVPVELRLSVRPEAR